MIGVPQADRERVVAAADVLVSVADPEFFGDRRPIEVLGEALWTLTQFATELAAHREQHPGDDLMTALVQAEVEGERLTHAEIGAFFVLLSVAGNDTTRHTTSHAMRALTVNPDQRALLMEDLDGRLPAAVEEFVRWASPVLTFRRTTTREVEIHGQQLGAGERVVLFYHSGNRDEQAFDGPVALRPLPRPQPSPRVRRGRPALLPRRLAGAHPAALDLRRAAARDAGHRGAGARAVAQQFHPRREAHAGELHRPSLRRIRMSSTETMIDSDKLFIGGEWASPCGSDRITAISGEHRGADRLGAGGHERRHRRRRGGGAGGVRRPAAGGPRGRPRIAPRRSSGSPARWKAAARRPRAASRCRTACRSRSRWRPRRSSRPCWRASTPA